jgi:hypothetical protein
VVLRAQVSAVSSKTSFDVETFVAQKLRHDHFSLQALDESSEVFATVFSVYHPICCGSASAQIPGKSTCSSVKVANARACATWERREEIAKGQRPK